jgi:peptidoglycan hydrolase CwlO-like protein
MRAVQKSRSALLLASSVLVVFAGPGNALDKDPAKGEYYTNEEVMQLSASERDEYCEKMEETLQQLQEETAMYQARLDSMQVAADTLRVQTLALSDSIRQVNNELRELRLQRKTLESYITKGGETLSQLAKTLLGDANLSSELIKANEKALAGKKPEDPLAAGIRLKIPH